MAPLLARDLVPSRVLPFDAVPSLTDPFQLIGTLLDGKYRVDEAIAQGGFGVVYRGEHVRLKRPVAIKVLARQGDGSADAEALVAQFHAEAELLTRLDHPAVVQVLDLGATAIPRGRTAPWMALEWVDGVTLLDDLRLREGDDPRTPTECLALMRPVLEALAQAHALGIAHRDVKPGNIMLVRDEEDARANDSGEGTSFGPRSAAKAPRVTARPRVRLLDFGIAKVMRPDELRPSGGDTATGAGVGAFSMRYASPEQLSGARTGPWTDVHALALVLTQLLTHRQPYPGEEAVSVAAGVLADRRPTPALHDVDVGAWEPVLAKALALRPAERYQDAGALLAALDGALSRATPVPRLAAPRPAVKGTTAAPSRVRALRVRAPWVAAGIAVALVGASVAVAVVGGSDSNAPAPRADAALADVGAAAPPVTAPAPPDVAELDASSQEDVAGDHPTMAETAVDVLHARVTSRRVEDSRRHPDASSQAPATTAPPPSPPPPSEGPRATTVAPVPL